MKRRVFRLSEMMVSRQVLYSIVFLVLLATINAQADLVAHYKFDGNVEDSILNGLHGTKTDAVVFAEDRFGQANSAVHFTSGSSAYISLGNQPQFNDLGNQFTIAFWAKIPPKDGPPEDWWIVDHDIDGSSSHDWSIRIHGFSGAVLAFQFGDDPVETGSSIIDDDSWHHIAVRRDRSSGNLWFFVDGNLDNSITGHFDDLVISHPITLGVNDEAGGGPNDGFRGYLDDLRFYNHTLSDMEIEAIVPIPSAIFLGSIGLGFSGWLFKRKTS